MALGKVPIASIGDAAAIISLLRERMRTFDELADDWGVAAFHECEPISGANG